MENEIWKPIKGFEGLYEVSNLGRIKSLPRQLVSLHGKERNYYQRGEFIFSTKQTKGYITITLKHKNKIRTTQLHRIVAEHFLPNPNNLPCVNHKDENKLNNRASNLEWCTYAYNLNYSRNRRRDSIPIPEQKYPLPK